MNDVRLSQNDFEKVILEFFIRGMRWAGTYNELFKPTAEQIDAKFHETLDEIIKDIKMRHYE